MARLKDLTPDCCKGCSSLTMDGNCRNHFKRCGAWRTWFRHEWAVIQKATENIKKERRAQRDRTRRTAP